MFRNRLALQIVFFWNWAKVPATETTSTVWITYSKNSQRYFTVPYLSSVIDRRSESFSKNNLPWRGNQLTWNTLGLRPDWNTRHAVLLVNIAWQSNRCLKQPYRWLRKDQNNILLESLLPHRNEMDRIIQSGEVIQIPTRVNTFTRVFRHTSLPSDELAS